MQKPTLEELCQGYKATYPAAITDILDTDFNLHHQWLGPEIRPLVPEMRLAGPAMTIRFVNDPVTADDEKYEKLTSQLVNDLKSFYIPIIDTSKNKNAGFWGELMCALSLERGISGAVIDGGVRDPYYIYRIGFNLFAAFACPHEANYNRAQLESVQRPILINDVVIRPGDFLMGDFGGVVVVPQEIVLDVYIKVSELVEKESRTRRLIKQGATVKEMLEAGGRL
jgi:4-hydroxy-4-methyl-2-oxoglutarate aldolase